MPWTRHFRSGRDVLRRAFDAANSSGDVTFAAFSCASLNVNFLAAGDPLADAQREAENGLRFAEAARFAFIVDIITAQLGLIRMLRGLTPRFGTFDDGQFDEGRFERHLSANPALALPECWYWVRKLQARFFAGDYAAALDAASRARRLRWSATAAVRDGGIRVLRRAGAGRTRRRDPCRGADEASRGPDRPPPPAPGVGWQLPGELRRPRRAGRRRDRPPRRPRARRRAAVRAGHPRGPRQRLRAQRGDRL